MPRLSRLAAALALSTALVAAGPALAKSKAAQPAPVAELVKAVDIPWQAFTLDNGLRVIVHEDRKAPVVAVSVWYRVGSKHEPKGKTGFAHLFEHLMFNGSENAPGDFFEPLQQVGATDFNGTTSMDRTNYFETVPTGALDRALFLESDRMGHLLGAVTQDKLDNQRGVVQNEKRQGDNNPFGLLRYEIFENLFPTGHPYHHSTIGSMADLDSASLDDVKRWFTDHYGPNNAVLVLAGDIDVATAKAKVTEWFGDIAQGPAVTAPPVSVPTLPAPLAREVRDLIPTTRLYRMWAIPGLNDPEAVPLQMAATVLGGLSSSRLDNAMVRKDPVAVAVAAFAQTFEDAGILIVQADVKEGVDPALVGQKLDAEIAKFLETGPTADELQRAAASYLGGTIAGLESVGGFGGKAVTLAEGALYSNDPDHYRTELDRLAKTTPEQAAAVARKWMARPAFSLTYTPGERTEGGENRGGAVTAGKAA
ncbi:MAG: pitrilysin family protein, partial [Sphingopyxis granuli]